MQWLVYNLASSKHCPTGLRDPRILLYEYSLPDLMMLKQQIEIMEALETASHKDHEAKINSNK